MTDMQSKIARFFNIVKSEKDFAYDVETSGLKWQTCRTIGYSVSDGRESVYIPVRHSGGGNIYDVDNFEQNLARATENHPAKIIGHHLKFDAHFSENHGVKLGNKLKDTMTRAALLNENRRSYSLDACCREFPDIPQKHGQELYEHIAQVTACKADRSSMANYHLLPGDDVLAVEYAEGDTRSTYALCDKQEKEIYGQNLEVVANLENELTYVLQKMERRGVKVDLEQAKIVKDKIEDLRIQAYSRIPLKEDMMPINVRSSKDLQEYFEMCMIDDWPMTAPTERFPEGQPSFGKDYLSTHDEGLIIIEAKKYDHLLSGFIEPLPKYLHNERIHTNFNQTRTEFGKGVGYGRLSSTEPNMQQIPKRDEETGRIYRSIFVPDNNYIFIEYDHSQAEPRLYAHYSGEQLLIDGYNRTPFIDMHQIAAELMHIDRKTAKNLNLGMLYTMGAPKLAWKLKISIDEARAIAKAWYRTFRSVSAFTRKAADVVEERISAEGVGYVYTILGRRARFTDPRWSYRAANRIIQGSSADILKWKMVEIDRWLTNEGLHDYVHMLLNIHDAILFQVHKDYIKDLMPKLKQIFTDVQTAPFNLRVPFDAEYHMGDNWSEASYGQK